jgi:Flp pilus assembly protein TadG
LVFHSDKGAVTAEFMLLLPALILLLAGGIGMFQLGLQRIALEVSAFEITRAVAIGFEPELEPGLEMRVSQEGRTKCVSVTKDLLFKLESKRCLIPYGG